MSKIPLRTAAALGCILSCFTAVSAREVTCFSGQPLPDQAVGICITQVPETGSLRLGNRILRSGDVLTAEQAARMVFHSQDPESPAELSYLPLFPDGARETSFLSLGKKENKAPIAEDSAIETYKNLESTGSLRVTEPEQEAMTFTVVREPRRGSVTITPEGRFTYTPKKNKVGTDSFVYTAADPAGNLSREATVTVEILKPTKVPQYVDTAGQSCSFAAEWMKHTGLFVGETLGGSPCFQPEKPVTRGEFLSVLMKTLKIPPEAQTSADTEETVPVWLQPYLTAALRAGLTAGLPQEEDPDPCRPISGGEAAVLLQNALDFPVPVSAEPLPEDVPVWAADSLSALKQQGFSLDAAQPLTRAQAAELFYALREYTD